MNPVHTIDISGRVQGVFFRVSAHHLATKLDLTGFATNQPDGTVHLEVQGTAAHVQKFIDWCHQGSKYSHVTQVTTSTQPQFSQPLEPGFHIF